MDRIAVMLKTYKGDRCYFDRLIDSFFAYNVDGINLFVICPQNDMHLFETNRGGVRVIAEESIPVEFFKRGVGPFGPGYLNQEIVKMSFWKLGLCENYFCIDSECEFIRDFYVRDFMWDDKTPYTVFYDDSELMKDPDYYREYGRGRNTWNRIIMDALDVRGKKLFSCHGMGIISSAAMREFEKQYMTPRGLDYKDLIGRAPLEFTWYSYWVQKSGVIELHPVSPLVMSYHTEYQLEMDRFAGVGRDDLSRNYIGVLVNSISSKKGSGYTGITKVKKGLISLVRKEMIGRMKNDTFD